MKANIEIPDRLITYLHQATSVAVLTGAGISAESGVPTFREAQTGLWAKYDPAELATPQAFQRNPKLVWEWYTWRRELIGRAEPNEAHLTLNKLASHFPRFTLITQNVDGLHQRAGSRDVICLHGNIMKTKCADKEHAVTTWQDDNLIPPSCPTCGSLLRPDVVWFGENLPAAALQTAVQAAQSCELFLAVGTSAIVQPAASLPLIALERGATVVEINPQETPLSHKMDFVLQGKAGEVLPRIHQKLQEISN